ncbi:MAG: hypothetical protein ACLSVD_04580 [Eggerthellaceae bacterium]
MVGESLEQHCETGFQDPRRVSARVLRRTTARPRARRATSSSANDEEATRSFHHVRDEERVHDSSHHHKARTFKGSAPTAGRRGASTVLVTRSSESSCTTGHVDVSYRLKMYAIRPQFFLPMISILQRGVDHGVRRSWRWCATRTSTSRTRGADGDSKRLRAQLRSGQPQVPDGHRRDRQTILHLQKTKGALVSSENNLRLNNQGQDLTIALTGTTPP